MVKLNKCWLVMTIKYLLFFSALIFTLVGCAGRTSGELFPINNIKEVYVEMPAQEVLEVLGEPYIREPYIGGEKLIWSYSTKKFDHTFVVTIEEGVVRSLSEYKDHSHR